MHALILAVLFLWSLAQSEHIQARDLSLDMHIWVGSKEDEPLMERGASNVLTLSRSQALKVAVEIHIKDEERRIVTIEYRVSLRSGCGDVKPWILTEKEIGMPTYQGYGSVKYIDCDELYLGETELKVTVYTEGGLKVLREIRIPVEVVP